MATSNKDKKSNALKKDFTSPATKLLDKRRELYKAYEDYETQKEEFKKKVLYIFAKSNIGRRVQAEGKKDQRQGWSNTRGIDTVLQNFTR